MTQVMSRGMLLKEEQSTSSRDEQQEHPDQYLYIWKQLWSKRDTAWHLEKPHP